MDFCRFSLEKGCFDLFGRWSQDPPPNVARHERPFLPAAIQERGGYSRGDIKMKEA